MMHVSEWIARQSSLTTSILSSLGTLVTSGALFKLIGWIKHKGAQEESSKQTRQLLEEDMKSLEEILDEVAEQTDKNSKLLSTMEAKICNFEEWRDDIKQNTEATNTLAARLEAWIKYMEKEE